MYIKKCMRTETSLGTRKFSNVWHYPKIIFEILCYKSGSIAILWAEFDSKLHEKRLYVQSIKLFFAKLTWWINPISIKEIRKNNIPNDNW